MRATILPSAVILTKVHRATISMMAKGCKWSLSTGSEVFLIFTTQLQWIEQTWTGPRNSVYIFIQIYSFHILKEGQYCNAPNPYYLPSDVASSEYNVREESKWYHKVQSVCCHRRYTIFILHFNIKKCRQ